MAERVINVGTDQYRQPPTTQSGEPANPRAGHVQERPWDQAFPMDPVLMADAPAPRDTTPIAPDGPSHGPGSLGPVVEGWHPSGE